jgi:hypothetical protein
MMSCEREKLLILMKGLDKTILWRRGEKTMKIRRKVIGREFEKRRDNRVEERKISKQG